MTSLELELRMLILSLFSAYHSSEEAKAVEKKIRAGKMLHIPDDKLLEECFLMARQTVRKKLDQSLNRKLRRALGGQVDRIFDEIADQAKAAFLDEPSPPPRQPAALAAA